jgi:serine/threonine-protein kinase HipA
MVNARASALIFKKGRLAATFSKTDNGVRFEYDSEYLSSDGAPVATTLPATNEPITLGNGATPAFFAGLLPEGPRLIAMKNRIKTSLSDELGLLLEIGSDLIGDVQILPEGGNPSVQRERFDLPAKGADFSFTDVREKFFGSRQSGLPGVQDKVSSKMFNAPVKMANIDYILKLNPEAVPFAVENEHYFLGLANECGITTSKFELLADSYGQKALLLKRFDRVVGQETKTRLAAEDACQALNKYPSEKYNVEFLDVAEVLISLCPAKAVAGLTLFRQLVFNWLIGNGDAHAKNFSILENADGEWMISPAYDLICTAFYDDKAMALPIDGLEINWSRKLLIDAAAKMSVPQRAAHKVIDGQLKVLVDLPQNITDGALPFARHENYDIARFLKQRAKRLAAI